MVAGSGKPNANRSWSSVHYLLLLIFRFEEIINVLNSKRSPHETCADIEL